MRTLEFQRIVGAGAVGSVYLADLVGAQGFRRQVAVKVLLSNHPDGDMFMSRVRDEARLLGLLQSDSILKVIELVRVDGRDAVLMEYVEGIDLGALIEGGHRPPPRALAELIATVAGALHRAHTAVHPATKEPLNVIHRDVKPPNIMVTSQGSVKLLDFGVARARFDSRESYTGQFVLGTLNYMAPEYILHTQVSSAADIFALAITAWESATGEVFGQPKLRKEQHEARVEERLVMLGGEHRELAPVLREMLAWDPAARPSGADVERSLLKATDLLRGTGLRSWAGEVMSPILSERRTTAQDQLRLAGRSVAISAEAPAVPADVTHLAIERPSLASDAAARPAAAAAPRPAPRPAPAPPVVPATTPPAPSSGPKAAPTPAQPAAPTRSPAPQTGVRPRKKRSTGSGIGIGIALFTGGVVGMMILVVFTVLLLLLSRATS